MNLHDDILGAILERIDSHVSLIRAASTCKRCRSIITDAAFRRSFRSLHTPAIARDYCNYSPLHPFIHEIERRTKGLVLFIPSPLSSIDASHFSLDFLPDHDGAEDNWMLEDNRGSLLLLKHSRFTTDIRYLILCEPLTRQYRKIPQPPELVDGWNITKFRRFYLIDGAEEDEASSGNIGMSKFRLVCEHYMGQGMHIMVFDPDDGSDASSTAWKEKDVSSIVEAGVSVLHELGRAAGSWYFCDVDLSNVLIVLDGRTGEFSTSMLPASENWEIGGSSDFCVTEGRDGKPRVCSVVDGTMKVFAMHDDGECTLEKTLVLGEAIGGLACTWLKLYRPVRILTRGPGFIILLLHAMWIFSVDLETMKVAPGVDYMRSMVYPFELPWPQRLRR